MFDSKQRLYKVQSPSGRDCARDDLCLGCDSSITDHWASSIWNFYTCGSPGLPHWLTSPCLQPRGKVAQLHRRLAPCLNPHVQSSDSEDQFACSDSPHKLVPRSLFCVRLTRSHQTRKNQKSFDCFRSSARRLLRACKRDWRLLWVVQFEINYKPNSLKLARSED